MNHNKFIYYFPETKTIKNFLFDYIHIECNDRRKKKIESDKDFITMKNGGKYLCFCIDIDAFLNNKNEFLNNNN